MPRIFVMDAFPALTRVSQGRLKKLEAMKRLCPILVCAAKSNIAYCPRDCAKFPCEIYDSELPYSKRFLGIIQGALKR